MRALGIAAVMAVAFGPAACEPLHVVDEWEFLGECAYGVATAGLTATPPDGVRMAFDPEAGRVRFACFTLAGPDGEARSLAVALVEKPDGAQALYTDADLDGVVTLDEALASCDDPGLLPPGFARGEETVWLTEPPEPPGVTAAFRVSGFGATLSRAVRGYASAALPVGGRLVPVAVVDVNGDGVAERARDVVLLDLDGDGACVGPAEERRLYRWMDVEDSAFRLTVGGPLASVEWSPAPTGVCPVTFRPGGLGTGLESFSASLVREGSGPMSVSAADAAVDVPFGEYGLSSLDVTAVAGDGDRWTYAFVQDTDVTLDVTRPDGLTLDPLEGLEVRVTIEGTAEPGAEVTFSAEVRSPLGLILAYCGRGGPGAAEADVAPDLEVRAPDGSVVLSGSLSYG